jgi:uncharacterized GH25 family protein
MHLAGTNYRTLTPINTLIESLMKKSCRALLALVLAAVCQVPAQAHEFWIAPVTAPLAASSTVRLSLWVGEQFTGELVGWSKAQTAGLRLVSQTGVQDISAQIPAAPVADLPIALVAPGTNVVAFESQSHTINLSADSFHAYLHDEGLDFIKAQRVATGQAKRPGRERYRRYVKTLLAVQGTNGSAQEANSNPVHSQTLGQRLELVPVNNPLDMMPGQALSVQALFEGKPLPGALLKAWHKSSGQTVIIRASTNPQGIATVNLPYPGAWMVSLVHMVRVTGVPGVDWDSLWGNLSFSLPEKK